MLVEYLKDINRDGKIVIADANNMRTSKKLHMNGYNKDQIIVFENNLSTHLVHKKSNLCNAKFGEFYNLQLNNEKTMNDVNGAYIDLFTSIEGNEQKEIYPLEIIQLMLKQTKHKEFILGITSAMRTSKGIIKPFKNIFQQTRSGFLGPIISFSQFKIINRFERIYRRKKKTGKRSMTMGFFLYHLKRDPRINKEKVKFLATDGKYIGYRN